MSAGSIFILTDNRYSSTSSAFIHPLLDVGLSSYLPSLPILSRTDPIFRDSGCNVVGPPLLWPLLVSSWCLRPPYWCPVGPSVLTLFRNVSNPAPLKLSGLLKNFFEACALTINGIRQVETWNANMFMARADKLRRIVPYKEKYYYCGPGPYCFR